MKQLILINGLKRSGKDYLAELIREIEGEINVISFADPIKQIIADTFSISLEQLEDYKNDEVELYTELPKLDGYDYLFVSDFRKILQRFGTEAMKKQFGQDVWAKRGIDLITESDSHINVIPDFRFLIEFNEAVEQATEHGYNVTTINIFNKDLPTPDLHASERELSDNDFEFDYTIDNTGQPANIKEIVKKILSNL